MLFSRTATPKVPLTVGASATAPIEYMVSRAHPSQHSNGITIGSAAFARLMVVTDRPLLQMESPSVAIGRIYGI